MMFAATSFGTSSSDYVVEGREVHHKRKFERSIVGSDFHYDAFLPQQSMIAIHCGIFFLSSVS